MRANFCLSKLGMFPTMANSFIDALFGSSDENNFVYDSRGFNTIVKGEASEFLNCTENFNCFGDPHLLLNTPVTNVSYSDSGVTITTDNGTCIEADYAICTFSVGVLQNEAVTFDPPFPDWKQNAIDTFQMGECIRRFWAFSLLTLIRRHIYEDLHAISP